MEINIERVKSLRKMCEDSAGNYGMMYLASLLMNESEETTNAVSRMDNLLRKQVDLFNAMYKELSYEDQQTFKKEFVDFDK